MIAAVAAAAAGAAVTVIDKNEKPGLKLRITGKGRCNITNACDTVEELLANIPTNPRFLYSAFSKFLPKDTIAFFEGAGVPLKTERGRRVFPASDSAHDVADALVRVCKKKGVRFLTERVICVIITDGEVRGVQTQSGDILPADAVVIATGGKSYPKTGSTGDGYTLAEQAGHTIVPPTPSLVSLICHEACCADLMGLSLRNTALQVLDSKTGKTVFSDFGELLFTHFGVSGPMALSASAHLRPMEPMRYTLLLDLKPALPPDKLDARILRDFAANQSKTFPNALHALLPKSLVPVIVKRSGIPPALPVAQITGKQRLALGSLLKAFPLTVKGFRPIEEAIVTSGGVCVRELDPKSMQSKLCAGLYFAGEVLDADAYTGGFNLQIAWSTGHLAGVSAGNAPTGHNALSGHNAPTGHRAP
jgi:predicted Rossmann fold flavoprotein